MLSAYTVVSADPNRLRLLCRKVGRAAYFLVRRWIAGGSQTEQGLECRHGVLSAVMPKDEFVQINWELSAAHAVMGPDQPLLQVTNCVVSQGHDGLRAFTQINWQR